jgi:hypothetical protein
LDVLEFGCEVALEIVLDDEDAKEIRIASRTNDVPGKSGDAECRDRDGMKQAKGVTPALREQRPEEDGAAAEDDSGGTFGEDGETEKETEGKKSEPWCHGDGRGGACPARAVGGDRILRGSQAEGDRRDHGDRQHCAEGHVCGSGVREANHADGGGEQKQQPPCGLHSIQAQRQPSERECRQQGRDGARQARSRFTDAKKLEAECCAPVVQRRFLEPRLAIKPRCYPVAGFYHVASDPRIARLVRSHEAERA